MSPEDREAWDRAVDALRELGPDVLERASTLATMHATHVAQSSSTDAGQALLYAARLLYVLAHETPGETLG